MKKYGWTLIVGMWVLLLGACQSTPMTSQSPSLDNLSAGTWQRPLPGTSDPYGSGYSPQTGYGTGYGSGVTEHIYGTGYNTGYGTGQGMMTPNQPNYSVPTPAPGTYPTTQPSFTPHPSAAPSLAPSAFPSQHPGGLPLPGSGHERYDYRQNFFQNYGINPFVETELDPLSTFAVDVDTAAYTLTRSYLNSAILPPPEAVRTEEFINYFNYRYPQPLQEAFAIHTELAPAYFRDAQTRMLRIGLQGREVLERNRKRAVLTLLIDVSGSMNRENRLELVKQSLSLLLDSLKPNDFVAIVTFGSEARLQLPHTALTQRDKIQAVLDNLRPEGSTNTSAGLKLAYLEASRVFQRGETNRVILCSDGIANIGATGPQELLEEVRLQRQRGITLTTLGFGLQGFNDYLMEQLANQGNGHYAYIDSLAEARRVLVDQLTSTLELIASDVKVQVDFNPEVVSEYRLLGYENRDIADEDFRNDAIDAGEVGANHSVTALYELRFRPEAPAGRLATVFLRYKDTQDLQIKELTQPVQTTDLRSFSNASESLKLALAAAEFAEILRHSIFAQDGKLQEVAQLGRQLQNSSLADADLSEWLQLVEQAQSLKQPPPAISISSMVSQSENPKALPEWQAYLLRQLGGLSARP